MPPKKSKTASPSKAAVAKYDPCPRSEHYEFGGPIGALFVTISVPFFAYWLSFACTKKACPPWPLDNFIAWHKQGWNKATTDLKWWQQLWNPQVAQVYLAWYAWTVLCRFILPGEMVQGSQLRNGDKKTYPMNGQFSAVAG